MPAPPTPSSLLGLPDAWLLSLVTCEGLDEDRRQQQPARPLVSLFRTCAALRDLVLRHRQAVGKFDVMDDTLQELGGEVDRLCTLARRSGNVKLVFEGPRTEDDDDGDLDEDELPPAEWTHTEPRITHLLVCAMAELGGQPLTCVKEVRLRVRLRWRSARGCVRVRVRRGHSCICCETLCVGAGAQLTGVLGCCLAAQTAHTSQSTHAQTLTSWCLVACACRAHVLRDI